MADELSFASVVELGRRLRAKKISATELAEHFLDRLERLGTTFGAVVTVTRGRALAEAAAADRDIARGRWRGPLHGIPYGVKDLLAAAGYPTTWGAAPYDNQLFAEDAEATEETREGHLDKLDVIVEARPEVSDRMTERDLDACAKELQHGIKTYVGVSTKVRVLAAGSMERTSTGKAKRVVDKRPKVTHEMAKGSI